MLSGIVVILLAIVPFLVRCNLFGLCTVVASSGDDELWPEIWKPEWPFEASCEWR